MGLRSWTVAIRCSTRLICRLPPRDNRCRTWSPEEASIGAVPVRPGREVRLVGEAGDVTDLDQEPGCAGGADAVQVEQRGAGGFHVGDEFLVGLLLALVDPLEVFNQLQGDPFASDADNVGWLHAGQQSTGLGGREVPFGAAGDQLQQQLVQLAHLHGVFLTDPAAAIN